MIVDGNIGGGIDGTAGGDLAALNSQLASAQQVGLDGVWSTEVNRDPFLPLALAAAASTTMSLGTAVAVAFARSPMTTAAVANDLQCLSRGRFILGLGTQIRPHIERRFSMAWTSPADRMLEYVAALQSIWHSWQTGSKLDFRGDHYQHTLMTPMFTPEPHPWGPPPVILAAVGPKMTEVASTCADGLLVHSFTTARYLREVTLPTVLAGLQTARRRRADFTICYPGLIATGADETELAKNVSQVRRQIAFYGATPAYRSVLDLHGLGELHTELNRLSKAGQWSSMTDLIDGDVLRTFAVVGEPTDVGHQIGERFHSLVDRFTLYTPYPLDDASKSAIVEGMRRSY